MINKKDIGSFGENIAVEYLIHDGYTLLNRNYRTRIGEIDIIVNKDNLLCFVEVKTRYNCKFGYPCEAVNNKKRNTIMKISLWYMCSKKLHKYNVRFDVIEILLNYADDSYSINHLIDAF